MKNYEFSLQDFRDMTVEENHACTGGGFAYDVGRFIRFSIINVGGGVNTAMAIADAIATQYK